MTPGPAPAIVVLTGAGISAESGLRTFRDADGLWEDHRVEDVATPEGFRADPALVHAFYNQRRAQLDTVQPNPAHLALARLEQHWPGEFLLVTQNVDDLHERAGSRNLVHMHGELRKVRCLHCGRVQTWARDTAVATPCPHLRPDGWAAAPCGLVRRNAPGNAPDPGGAGALRAVPGGGNLRQRLPGRRVRGPRRAPGPHRGTEPGTVPGQPRFMETRLGPASVTVPALVDEWLGMAL